VRGICRTKTVLLLWGSYNVISFFPTASSPRILNGSQRYHSGVFIGQLQPVLECCVEKSAVVDEKTQKKRCLCDGVFRCDQFVVSFFYWEGLFCCNFIPGCSCVVVSNSVVQVTDCKDSPPPEMTYNALTGTFNHAHSLVCQEL